MKDKYHLGNQQLSWYETTLGFTVIVTATTTDTEVYQVTFIWKNADVNHNSLMQYQFLLWVKPNLRTYQIQLAIGASKPFSKSRRWDNQSGCN